MTRLAILTTLVVTSLTLGAQRASAESYISLGFGEANTSGQMPVSGIEGDALRISIGKRFGKLSLEGTLASTDFVLNGQDVYDTKTASVDLKYHLKLGGPIELYGKGGLNKTWDSRERSGNGHELGAGIQWNLRLPVTSAALWVEYTYLDTELADASGNERTDGGIGLTMVGASLGF